jgi:hypothetical protein
MITGAFKESTGMMIVGPAVPPAVSDNSATPGIIITQNAFFVVERITGISTSMSGVSVKISIQPGSLSYGNTPNGNGYNLPMGLIVGSSGGLSMINGKPIFIINPNSKINVVLFNIANDTLCAFVEFEGYYTDEKAVRVLDGQHINSNEVLSLL